MGARHGARSYYCRRSGNKKSARGNPMNAQLDQIINAPLPAFRGNIRPLYRKEWAAQVRKLFRDMQLTGISVTAPSYSMAQSIDIRLPRDPYAENGPHDLKHQAIDRGVRFNSEQWNGYANNGCEYCRQEWQAHKRIKEIVLAAFPDLDDRSDSMSDHFDYCLSIN